MPSSHLLEIKNDQAILKIYEPIIEELVMSERKCSKPLKHCGPVIKEHTSLEVEPSQHTLLEVGP